jgi:hypothetical protein
MNTPTPNIYTKINFKQFVCDYNNCIVLIMYNMTFNKFHYFLSCRVFIKIDVSHHIFLILTIGAWKRAISSKTMLLIDTYEQNVQKISYKYEFIHLRQCSKDDKSQVLKIEKNSKISSLGNINKYAYNY